MRRRCYNKKKIRRFIVCVCRMLYYNQKIRIIKFMKMKKEQIKEKIDVYTIQHPLSCSEVQTKLAYGTVNQMAHV